MDHIQIPHIFRDDTNLHADAILGLGSGEDESPYEPQEEDTLGLGSSESEEDTLGLGSGESEEDVSPCEPKT